MDEARLLYYERHHDGMVIYNLAPAVFKISRDEYPMLHDMNRGGELWPYFIRKVLAVDEENNLCFIKIEEVPEYQPGTGRRRN